MVHEDHAPVRVRIRRRPVHVALVEVVLGRAKRRLEIVLELVEDVRDLSGVCAVVCNRIFGKLTLLADDTLWPSATHP